MMGKDQDLLSKRSPVGHPDLSDITTRSPELRDEAAHTAIPQ